MDKWEYGKDEKWRKCKSCVEINNDQSRKKTRLFQEAGTGIVIRRCINCIDKIDIMVG